MQPNNASTATFSPFLSARTLLTGARLAVGAALIVALSACGGGGGDGGSTSTGGNGGTGGQTSYTATPSVSGGGGTISPSSAVSVKSGATTAFTVTPNSGYSASVSGTCGGTLSGTTYTTKAITGNCTVVASFAATSQSYTVTPSVSGGNGAINPSSAVSVKSGATATFTVTPTAGYTASVGGTCQGTLSGATYTTQAITGNCTVVATFAASGSSAGLCTASVNGSYALPADRGTAWNLAGLQTRGGVPSANWPVCNATPLKPNGTRDDSAAINSLIQSCAPGTVAQLGQGTFLMGQGQYVLINKGVALRGAGAGLTVLNNPLNSPMTAANVAAGTYSGLDASPIIIVGPARWINPDGDQRCNQPTPYQPAYMQLLSVDGAKGAMSVTVANGSIFKAGMFVLLDETSGAAWQPARDGLGTSVWASPDYAVQWDLHQPPALYVDDPLATVTPSSANNWATTGSGNDAACWFGRQDRPQNEMKEIASVSGNTVTFTSPLHKSYRVGQHAELTTYTGGNALVVGAGVEKLTALNGGNGGIRFENTAYSWAKNVEVTAWWGEGVALDGAFRTELRDSYIHDAAWPEPGGAGYAISTASASSELLIENNIARGANKVMVARSSGAGSVVGYNYMDDGYIATTSGWIEIGLNGSHMVGPHHMLFEGNQSFNMDSDDTHGNSTYHTYFRNWASSVRSKFNNAVMGDLIDDANQALNGPKRAAGAAPYSYWMSFVGNVLGAPGITTAANGYVDDSADWTTHPSAIWLLGWNGGVPYTTDTKVAATALRDGNWDVLLGKQTWLTGSAAALPNSCYLSSKPAFFGSNTWPWVDPATGVTRVLPAKARYDAGTPNTVPGS